MAVADDRLKKWKMDTGRSRRRAIRCHCLECMGGEQAEIPKCQSVSCSLWPFRSGQRAEECDVEKHQEAVGLGLSPYMP